MKKFDKYTTEELKTNLEKLEKKADEQHERMNAFKAERDVEFFRVAEEQFHETCAIIMDVKMAIEMRNR